MQINDLKKNQVVDVELKNNLKVTVQFKGVSKLVDSKAKITNSKLVNFAKIELDYTKPQPTEFELFSVNINQIKSVEINEIVADKLDKVLWKVAAVDTQEWLNKIDFSKITCEAEVEVAN
jgi:hypothetical protein